jgi:predicted aspartyl protease
VQVDVPVLLDTGSDVSIVPRSVASSVGASTFQPDTRLEFFDGTDTSAEAAILTIELLRFRFQGDFVVGDRPYGILGRNILNSLTVTFDGPNLTWSA